MPVDFLAPAFGVAVNGVMLTPAVANAVTSVIVTHELDSLDHFTLSVANEFPDLPFTHGDQADLFQEGNSVTVKLGYRDALESVFDGQVTRVRPTFPDHDTPTVTIDGHSRLHWLRGATKTRTFVDVTDSDIASRIANEAGLQPQTDATDTKHPYVIQANLSDLDFLLDRARRIRYELLVQGTTLIFRKPADGKAKSFTLVWGDPQRGFDPDHDTLPLSRFEPVLDALAPATSVTIRGQDPSTRDPITGTATDADADDTSGTSGAAVANNAFSTAHDATVVDIPVASQAEADEIAKALFNERVSNLVTGRGACVGTPKIRTGQVVELAGIGPRFSGSYLVTRSTHRLDSSGYETIFSVRRGAVG
ncbi:contractile injection system protein, VgrG/Pvc8 family [Kribbella sp. NBC_01484]|uniref:phage late control D family protein n=1 Tax=Kribbella sp. NBC_01484 TaxID=2903579 RepID=UPI002E376277|nr:contractile injection system protein, VgrG/Pvc8 family [Kribbella sp. NBC_01484]